MPIPTQTKLQAADEARATATVYREYARQGLARAYDTRGLLPEHVRTEHLATYAERSRQARASLPARLDLAYGDRPAQKLDVFTPTRAPAPIVVYFHGGDWRYGCKENRAFPAELFTRAGAVWIPVGYSLCPTVTLDEMIEEARAAVGWIYRNAPSFGGDRRRIHVAGTSAGAHLAAMALGTDWQERGLPADVVKGGMLVSGIYDFEPLTYHHFPDPAELFRDHARQQEPRSYRWLSPMDHLPRAACQAVVAVGEEEPAELRRQSIDYYDALRKHGLAAQLLISPGHDHFSIVGEWGRLRGALARATLIQLGLA